MIETRNDNLEQWSKFWDQGFITTFGDGKPDNYDGVVREFWQEIFLGLSNGSRILDIACGNGAIATIAAEIGIEKDKGFVVAATDLANIQVELIGEEKTKRARRTIEFHSRVPCERQPFDDESFDVVTSQFGFEYSDPEKSLAEIRRILVPEGRFSAICHHTGSLLIKAARTEREIYRMALDEFDILGLARRYFEALGELPGDPTQFRDARASLQPLKDQLNHGVRSLQARYGNEDRTKFIVGVLSYIARSARETAQSERLIALDGILADFELHRARLIDMADSALDSGQIDALTVMARSAGFESVRSSELLDVGGGLAGWQVIMG